MKRIVGVLLVLIASMVVLLGGDTSDGNALSGFNISVSGITWTANLVAPYAVDATDPNGQGYDYFCVVCRNTNGTLQDIDFRRVRSVIGGNQNQAADCDGPWAGVTTPLSVSLIDTTTPWSGGENGQAAADYCGVLFNPTGLDLDNDTVPNETDNCVSVANTNQANFDSDLMGDACDPDDDGDGVNDGADACPNTPTGTPVNSAGCTDTDGDGVANTADNCPFVANADQADADNDGMGDACDTLPDADGDGEPDVTDNCPNVANPDQADTDNDGIGDACDTPADPDADGDGVADSVDNCVNVPNLDQADTDNDGIGDACEAPTDPDADGDGVADTIDQCPNTPPGTAVDAVGCAVIDPPADGDGDGVNDEIDECPNTPPGTVVNQRGCTRRSVNPGPNPEPVQPVVAGCDVNAGSPKGAVGGTILISTWTYWMPDLAAQTNVMLDVGKTAKVLGMDAGGGFFLVVWNCSYLWVPVGTIGPTYDNVWNGMPLPVTVVG